MGERRYVHELSGRRTSDGVDEDLERLMAHKDRVIALLRAGRRSEEARKEGRYRSPYAARLWALAHAEWSEPSEGATG